MFYFQTTNEFYSKEDKNFSNPVGSITLTHSIERLPAWDISLDEEFEKYRGSHGDCGKSVYAFRSYLSDCLEADMDKNEYGCSLYHDLKVLDVFCKGMDYVFETTFDFTNFYMEYMQVIDEKFGVEYPSEEEGTQIRQTYLEVLQVTGMRNYELLWKELCGKRNCGAELSAEKEA